MLVSIFGFVWFLTQLFASMIQAIWGNSEIGGDDFSSYNNNRNNNYNRNNRNNNYNRNNYNDDRIDGTQHDDEDPVMLLCLQLAVCVMAFVGAREPKYWYLLIPQILSLFATFVDTCWDVVQVLFGTDSSGSQRGFWKLFLILKSFIFVFLWGLLLWIHGKAVQETFETRETTVIVTEIDTTDDGDVEVAIVRPSSSSNANADRSDNSRSNSDQDRRRQTPKKKKKKVKKPT